MFFRHLSATITASIIALLLAAPADARRKTPTPEAFKIQGDSQSLASIVFPLKEAYQDQAKMPLQVIGEVSPLKGLEEVDQGIGDALVVAMSFEELNRLAAEAGLKQGNKPMTLHSVLMDELSYRVIVNPKNPVTKLSTKELRRIFSGRYKGWDDVDGDKSPISVVWGDWSTGASWVLADKVMEDEQRLKETVHADNVADIVARVAGDAKAIGIVPANALSPAVKAVETPELKINGPIIMVTVGFPLNKHTELIKLIKGDGRQLVGY